MKQSILCLPGEDATVGRYTLADVLKIVPYDVENVLICGSEVPSQSELVSWVYNSEVMRAWEDAGTFLGQEAEQNPVISLARLERRVRIRWAQTWFDEFTTAEDAQRLLREADRLVVDTFKVTDANFASPVALGQHLMAACWSRDGIKVPPAPPEIRDLLTTIGPQGRHEILTEPHLDTIPGLYGYDMRLAYLWCCKGLPYGEVHRNDWHPGRPDGQKVRATWAAPDGWRHIGLLPERQQGWQYPLQGEGWIDGREWQQAERNGWHVDVDEQLNWESEGALDRWSDGLQSCLRQSRENKALYRLFRRVALNSIGSLHRTHIRRSRALPAGGREKPPQGEPSLKLSDDGSTFFWQEQTPVRGRQMLYCHPEWTTTIWARCRARITQAALQFPREQVIAIRQDALFTSHPHPTWKEGPRVGDLRLKEWAERPLPAPHSLEQLQRLRGFAVAD